MLSRINSGCTLILQFQYITKKYEESVSNRHILDKMYGFVGHQSSIV